MPSPLLDGLVEAVRQAGEIALAGFSDKKYELKPDGSLVTPYDHKVEEFLRGVLAELAPGAAVWGEEQGFAEDTADGLWLIDPIDGTSNYAFGMPYWGVTVGLYKEGRIAAGVMTMPCLGQSLSAEEGQGAFLNGQRLPLIRPGGIEDWELVGHGDLSTRRHLGMKGKTRHMGAFVAEGFGFVTQGLRAMTSSNCRLYDAAATLVAARELGAVIVHFDGRPFRESDWIRPGPLEPFALLPPGCTLQGAPGSVEWPTED